MRRDMPACSRARLTANLLPMPFSGHQIGLLKEYMHDLVEQARQEAREQAAFGFSPPPYQPDQAIADLLAILDDRIESEEQVWLESNLGPAAPNKARIRELTYKRLIAYLEQDR